ncbi:MAG: hypothetical protein ACE141_09750 [Bryobacteraceae bacterium]
MERRARSGKQARGGRGPERSEDGVDLTLIRWMLSLTPAERLRVAQDFANSIARLRAGRAKA